MPLIARGNAADDVTTECTPTTTDGHSPGVYVVDVLVHRQGDANDSHYYNSPACDASHTTNILTGSPTVFADGKGVARLGDMYNTVDTVSTVNQGTVFADG